MSAVYSASGFVSNTSQSVWGWAEGDRVWKVGKSDESIINWLYDTGFHIREKIKSFFSKLQKGFHTPWKFVKGYDNSEIYFGGFQLSQQNNQVISPIFIFLEYWARLYCFGLHLWCDCRLIMSYTFFPVMYRVRVFPNHLHLQTQNLKTRTSPASLLWVLCMCGKKSDNVLVYDDKWLRLH